MSDNSKLKLLPNEILFSQGDEGDCAYIIEKGRILIFLIKDKEEIPLTILGEGEIFGEMSLIDNQLRSASAKALDESILHSVTRDQLMKRINNADNIVKLLMRVLLKRLRQNNTLLANNAKDNKKNKKTQFDTPLIPQTKEDSSALELIRIENEIFNAFQKKEFSLFYQGIYNLKDKTPHGCESLMRWISPEKGIVSPNAFIDIIEHSSMVLPIGEWTIRESLLGLKEIQDDLTKKGHLKIADHFLMSVNISGKQFIDENFISVLKTLTQQLNVNPSNVKLEMTERIMLDGSLAIENLSQIRQLGFNLSIDDFGTGFSSLQYLTQMPISHLKIDRSFVMRLNKDPKAKAIVSTIIFLAESLNMKTIAEGIETEEELKILIELGAEFGQGYLFNKAQPMEKYLQNLFIK